MSTVDIIILLCFIPGVIRGLSKGFLEQGLTLIGIILSVWAAFKFSNLVCTWIKPYLEVSDTVLHVVAFALVLVVVILAALLLAKLLTKAVEAAMLGWLNKGLGVLAACAVTALVLGLLIILFETLNLKFQFVKADTLSDSVLYGPLRDAAYVVFPYLKQLLFKQ